MKQRRKREQPLQATHFEVRATVTEVVLWSYREAPTSKFPQQENRKL